MTHDQDDEDGSWRLQPWLVQADTAVAYAQADAEKNLLKGLQTATRAIIDVTEAAQVAQTGQEVVRLTQGARILCDVVAHLQVLCLTFAQARTMKAAIEEKVVNKTEPELIEPNPLEGDDGDDGPAN